MSDDRDSKKQPSPSADAPGKKGRPVPWGKDTLQEAAHAEAQEAAGKARAQSTTMDDASSDTASDPAGRAPSPSIEFDINDVPIDRRGPLTGQVLEQRYLIKEKLGVGGMGVVYRAEHRLMRKEMAVKVLLPEYGSFEGIQKRFHREAQSSSRLDHPGIIHINDFGETEDGLLFIAMELLDGRSLTEVIRDEAPLSLERCTRIILQLALALDHAHGQGVVHRDLKPDNVMLLRKGEYDDVVKVLDFGIAKITQGDGAADALTEAGMVFGTPEYLSPEQAAGQAADARSDLYTLGVISYELLTGTRPFRASTKLELIGKHLNEKPEPMRKRAPELKLPAELDELLMIMLEKQPDMRIQSAAALIQQISGLEGVHTGPLPLWPTNTVTLTGTSIPALPVRRRHRSRNLLFGGLAGALIASIATVLVILYSGKVSPDSGGSTRTVVAKGVRIPNDQILAVQQQLAKNNVKEAKSLLEGLADQYPTDARVHLLTGHANFLDKKPDECLRSFKEAVRLDKTMKRNELLLSSIHTYLTWTKGRSFGWGLRKRAMEFVERYLDAGAGEMLTQFVNKWWERPLVWQAITFLLKHNVAASVDFVHAYELLFRHERSCAKRIQYLKDLIARRDARFLPLLKTISTTKVWRAKYARHGVSNQCIEAEVKAAITVLEALRDQGSTPPTQGTGDAGTK
ncbi:MAG: serine/threonine-protein kinase [bacterium]